MLPVQPQNPADPPCFTSFCVMSLGWALPTAWHSLPHWLAIVCALGIPRNCPIRFGSFTIQKPMPRLLPSSLSSGRVIPGVGFGTGTRWFKQERRDELTPDLPLLDDVVQAVKTALQAGFRHLDCAEMYGTEREMGVAIKEYLVENPGIKREDIWVTTKVHAGLTDVAQAARASLKRLGLEYVDLYLIHSPFMDGINYEQAWRAMESLVDEGLAKDIGVSNYRVTDLQELLSYARIKPVVNQVEAHPYLQQPELWTFCKQNGILVEAFSPLLPITAGLQSEGALALMAEVDRVAAAHSVTPAQVLLAWSRQMGLLPITTSSKPDRLREYLEVWTDQDATGSPGLTLTDQEVEAISALGAKNKYRNSWRKNFEDAGL